MRYPSGQRTRRAPRCRRSWSARAASTATVPHSRPLAARRPHGARSRTCSPALAACGLTEAIQSASTEVGGHHNAKSLALPALGLNALSSLVWQSDCAVLRLKHIRLLEGIEITEEVSCGRCQRRDWRSRRTTTARRAAPCGTSCAAAGCSGAARGLACPAAAASAASSGPAPTWSTPRSPAEAFHKEICDLLQAVRALQQGAEVGAPLSQLFVS